MTSRETEEILEMYKEAYGGREIRECTGDPVCHEAEASMFDDPTRPSHYSGCRIEPYEYITANELNWEQGNVIKYVTRYKEKNGKEDLLKAKRYIEMLIEREFGGTK